MWEKRPALRAPNGIDHPGRQTFLWRRYGVSPPRYVGYRSGNRGKYKSLIRGGGGSGKASFMIHDPKAGNPTGAPKTDIEWGNGNSSESY